MHSETGAVDGDNEDDDADAGSTGIIGCVVKSARFCDRDTYDSSDTSV